MSFAIDNTAVCDWSRSILRSDTIDLPDASLLRYINRPLREAANTWTVLTDEGGADLSGLSSDDMDLLVEALGWWVAARWIALPVTEEEQIVVKAKIASLEATFKVQEPEQFIGMFLGEGFRALFTISLIAPLIKAIRDANGGGLSGIIGVNVARQNALDHPEIPNPLNNLFVPRESQFVSPFGYPPIMPVSGGFPSWVYPAPWGGWLAP